MHLKSHLLTPFLLLLLVGILFSFSSCDDTREPKAGEKIEQTYQNLTPAQQKAESIKNFYHAWLADCVNDIYYDGKENAETKLRTLAYNRVHNATKSDSISSVFGQETIVWGPSVLVDQQAKGDLGTSYVSSNMMYCLQSITNTDTTFYIGISGTNMVSPYDWFEEDLAVGDTVTWKYGGKISAGSQKGFGNLEGLRDHSTGKTLYDFFKAKLGTLSHPKVKFAVSGHSLGGAMTQLYSSFLKNRFPKIAVEAWVYAGPTAGNDVFARTLTDTLDAYFAYNNTLDVVPHAWEKATLEKVCSLYNGLSFCTHEFVDNPILNAVGNFMIGKSSTIVYTIPGSPETFTGSTADWKGLDCDAFYTFIDGLSGNLYNYPNMIKKHCNGHELTFKELYDLYAFFIEMGQQHTTAYFDHFIDVNNPTLQASINYYVPGAQGFDDKFFSGTEGKNIFETFLKMIVDKDEKNCSCSS